jgi:hypothetical protein
MSSPSNGRPLGFRYHEDLDDNPELAIGSVSGAPGEDPEFPHWLEHVEAIAAIVRDGAVAIAAIVTVRLLLGERRRHKPYRGFVK